MCDHSNSRRQRTSIGLRSTNAELCGFPVDRLLEGVGGPVKGRFVEMPPGQHQADGRPSRIAQGMLIDGWPVQSIGAVFGMGVKPGTISS